MKLRSLIWLLCLLWMDIVCGQAQQTCPLNIDFSQGNLTHWEAFTGNKGNDMGVASAKLFYDSTKSAPNGTIGTRGISEYHLPSVTGIYVITSPGTDPFGDFPTLPIISGYQYPYALLLGSTSITGGGYIRGVSYAIDVPATPATQPYTMTYAYAIVLENGRHGSYSQPVFTSTVSLRPSSSILDTPINCASSKYYLPTTGRDLNSTAENEVLDTARAEAEGFVVSDLLSPNVDAITGRHLQDVWTKAWTEVTFDLSPYRGQRVYLSFEADNCVPGAHFGYAYVALRNSCAGLIISGPAVACVNSILTYSVPALAGATYNWIFPAGWTLDNADFSNQGGNVVHLDVGATGGQLIVNEQSSCAHLSDTIQVNTTPPTIPGQLLGDTSFCGGSNSGKLSLTGNNGSILAWLVSQDAISWDTIPDTTRIYNYQNITTTTIFRAEVQNGTYCYVDLSAPATVQVDVKSVGGAIQPLSDAFCADQTVADILQLQGKTGQVLDWQTSQDKLQWQDFQPVDTNASFSVSSLANTTYYRSIVKNGACPADTSTVATIQVFPTPFPSAPFDPSDTSLCHGGTAELQAWIQTGTSYAWLNADSLQTSGNGQVPSDPFLVSASASPASSTSYVLSISNAGCPKILEDTFRIFVAPPIEVTVTNDTNVVMGQPLQLHAASSSPGVNSYIWTPAIDLNNAESPDPVGNYGADINTVTYTVDAYDSAGCFGQNKVTVRVFKTGADIFVPNAFTPGKSMNNIFRPVPVGISDLQYFRVYNRWGQLVYATSQTGQGWDGSINGQPQETGTYVWMAEATDYSGKTIFRKGTMVLIR